MTTITKAEFETLPDTLKSKFTANGDTYLLLEEDVEGLRKSKAEILAEKKAMQGELETLKQFKTEFEKKSSEAEENKLKEAGAFKELEEKLRAKIAETEQAKVAEIARFQNNLKQERLTNELIKRGVLPDRAKYALSDIAEQVELVSDENGFLLKVKAGIGDAKEFDNLIEKVKEQSPFFFSATSATGGGATGNGNTGGSTAKTIPRSEWSKMTPPQQAAFIKSGGTPVD